MGRPSKLTDLEWGRLHRELRAGVSPKDLAKKYGVSQGTISRRYSASTLPPAVENVANMLSSADAALMALPPQQRSQVLDIVAQMKAVAQNMVAAAVSSSNTHRIMADLATRRAAMLTDCSDKDGLMEVAAAQRVSNLASESPHAMMGFHAKERAASPSSGPVVVAIDSMDDLA